jgi:hypothetical protein
MGWTHPFIGNQHPAWVDTLCKDISRIILWIEVMDVDQGLDQDTISGYITGAKMLMAQHLVTSEAWGLKGGARHSTIKDAIRSV